MPPPQWPQPRSFRATARRRCRPCSRRRCLARSHSPHQSSGEISWSSPMGLDNTLGELPSMFCGLSYDGYTDHSTPSDYFRFTDPQPVIFPQMAAKPSSNLSSNVSRATNTETEDWEFISDKSLNYICQMLMEKNIDEKVSIYQDIATLRYAAKPFYDILGHKFPPSPGHQMMPWSLDSPRPQ